MIILVERRYKIKDKPVERLYITEDFESLEDAMEAYKVEHPDPQEVFIPGSFGLLGYPDGDICFFDYDWDEESDVDVGEW